MRLTTWVAGLAAFVAAALGAAAPAKAVRPADDTYDLRGPAPKVGQTFASKGYFKVKDAKVVIKVAGETIRSKTTEGTITNYEIKYLAVEGRQATRVQTKIIKDATTILDNTDGEITEDKETSPLEGETVLSEFGGRRKWKNSLAGTQPDDEQKKKLADFTGPENDDALYPEGKVKVGHSWEADGAALVNLFDNSFTNIKGKVTQKFVKVEEVDGEECAVVETTGTLTCKAKADEGVLDLTMDLNTRTVWRSLKTGVDVKDITKGRMKYAGKLDVDGTEAEYLLDGPFESGGTTKLK